MINFLKVEVWIVLLLEFILNFCILIMFDFFVKIGRRFIINLIV